MSTVTPTHLWNCLVEPCRLRDLAEKFRELFGCALLGNDGKLLFPVTRRDGRRFSRTVVTGVFVCKHVGQLYSLYESKERYDDRKHRESWLEFIAGRWTSEVPKAAGMYFVKSHEGYASLHTIVQLPDGKLHDTDSGFVTTGKVTNWSGEWWSVRVPSLRGSK